MKKTYYKALVALCGLWCIGIATIAQEKNDELVVTPKDDESYEPLTVKINDSGSKFVRFIIWHQQWLQTNNRAEDDLKLQLNSFARRSRFLAYAQISPKFLILTHFGLNNLSTVNLSALGNDRDGPQLFLHDVWTEFKVSRSNALFVGTGLHYWKGLTRLSNASTLNFMTMDNPRPFVHWHSLGITDQFARHFGVYAKGQIGQFDYRFAINNPLNPANALGQGNHFEQDFREDEIEGSNIVYNGSATFDEDGDRTGNTIVEGYFRYNFFDTESTKLPYQVGTYFGKKKILGIGAGFFSHANGTYDTLALSHENVFHAALDVFYDAPAPGGAINAYVSFINFDYGDNYLSRWAGTGTNLYGQVGYFIEALKIMPYVAYQSGNYEALDDNITALNMGVNYYVNSHHAKITLEYHGIRNDSREADAVNGDVTQWRLQTHIFL